MITPKTTKLTLKRIVERLDEIPNDGFGTKPKTLSKEQKMRLMEMASMFENFGECLSNEEALMNSAKSLTEFVELAETYALTECGDVFQKNIVEKDMKEVKKRIGEFQKIIKETYARMQQAGVAYQDIGHILGRYYDLQKTAGKDQQYAEPPKGKQPLEMQEDTTRVCAWCKKPMGTTPGGTGETHGICPSCKDAVTKGGSTPELDKMAAAKKSAGI